MRMNSKFMIILECPLIENNIIIQPTSRSMIMKYTVHPLMRS